MTVTLDPQKQALLARYSRMRKDPLEFLRAVRTQDQVDKVRPIKAFPVDLDYIRLYAQVWTRERLIAVPKSRRMIMTWTNVCLYLWDTMFNVGRANAIVSKKEDDADDLIRRARFVLDNIDESKFPKELLPKYEYKYGKLSFPEIDSQLVGFPQGADQLRQFTFSGILADELAFWDKAQEMYSAAFPTLEGGGRFTAVSSAGPGFFKNMVFDQFGHTDDEGLALPPVRQYPIPGIEVWRNTRNKFFVFQLHYSANPKKRTDEFVDSVRSSMPVAQYLQEYEIRWDSFAGFPVYRDFDAQTHVSTERLKAHAGLPLLRGWDFGLTPACVIAQMQEDKLVVLQEFVETNMGADRFSDRVLEQCALLYPEWSDQREHWLDYIDPSGEFRKDTDEGTCARILDSKGLRPQPGPIAFEERRSSVEYFLVRRTKRGPCFAVDRATCPILVRGFEGGYRYPEKSAEIEPNRIRPLKDEHSHPHDALQYIASRIRMRQKRSKLAIPQLSYGWDRMRI